MQRANIITPLIVISTLVIGSVGIAFTSYYLQAQTRETCTVTLGDSHTVSLPVARTTAQKAEGLSGRDEVAPGMVFVWRWPQRPVVWMKDTRQPLDIAFVDDAGLITEMMTLPPESLTPHRSEREIVAMIELPAGTLEELAIGPGGATTAHQCGRWPAD